MRTREIARMLEIDRQLNEAKARRSKLSEAWKRLNQEKVELDAHILKLMQEQEDLRQGQLMFKLAQ